MPAKRYRVSLSVEEQQELKGLVSRGRTAAYKQTHARIMLLRMKIKSAGRWTMQPKLILRDVKFPSLRFSSGR